MLVRILALAILLPSVSGAAEPATEQDLEAAIGPVTALYQTLSECMKEGTALGLEGRRAKLSPVIDRAYDLDFMGSKALGSHWRTLDEAEQSRWLDTFRRLTVSTYAERFSEFNGEKLEVLEVYPANRGTAVVHTRIVPTSQDPVDINYRMRPAADGWRIIDVYLNGTVSELALRRSEYSAVIGRDGFNHLVESLDEKTLAPAPAASAQDQ